MGTISKQYAEYLELVNQHILDFIPEVDNKSITLYDSMKYSLEAGGKRLRPVLLLGSCAFAGGNIQEALPYACALEYIHNYTLIHDDLPCMDDDELRRGRKTNHIVFGEAIATLAGDGLLNTAFEVMYRDMFMYFDNEKALKARVRAAYAIAKGAGIRGVIAGQVADMEGEGCSCAPEMLDYIHINKTAALLVAAVRGGAMLGQADDAKLAALTTYGEALGLAFQIQDDILDITGTEEEFGKPIGSDAENNKLTYPSIHGLEASYARMEELCQIAMDSLADYGEEADFFRDIMTSSMNRRK